VTNPEKKVAAAAAKRRSSVDASPAVSTPVDQAAVPERRAGKVKKKRVTVDSAVKDEILLDEISREEKRQPGKRRSNRAVSLDGFVASKKRARESFSPTTRRESKRTRHSLVNGRRIAEETPRSSPSNSRPSTPERPSKDLEVKPSDRNGEEESEESDDSAGKSSFGRRRSARRPSTEATQSARVVFPLEVKASAVKRILEGEGQSQVARDLQCPLSTVASWWAKRENLLSKARAAKAKSPSKVGKSPSKVATEEEIPAKQQQYPLVPYERNSLLLTMRLRVEEAFQKKEEEVVEEEEMIPKKEEAKGFQDVERLDVDFNGQSNEGQSLSSGLSLILNSYADGEDDEEVSDEAS